MKKSKWDSIPQPIREMVISAFKMAEIDFERECVIPDEISNQTPNPSPWMTRQTAADYAHVSTDTIDNWCKQSLIQRAKLGEGRPGGVLIDRNSLEKFLRSKVTNTSKRVRQTAPSVKGGYRVSRTY